jgi:carboxyl-terminal processing protease
VKSSAKGAPSNLQGNYYDPTFRGMDVEKRFAAAEERIKTANSQGHILGIIAQALLDLDDSHTFFVPPPKAAKVEYGWVMSMIGDQCFVTAVRPGSDAEKQGLKPGDEIYALDGVALPAREHFWKVKYLYYSLRPRPVVKLTIRTPQGQQRELTVQPRMQAGQIVRDLTTDTGIWDYIREGEREDYLRRHRFYEVGNDALIWKMPQFDLNPNELRQQMGRLDKRNVLILDLRGNGGGLVDTLEHMAGWFFEREVKIADRKGRKEREPMEAKSKGDRAFKGKVVVLVDSESGSAAEIFARLMQIEKRGTVIGDRSAGAVMQSRRFGHMSGLNEVTFFATSVTNADVIMTDGKSLEHVGVTPDEVLLPSAADLAAGRDPVLARAAAIAGIALSPERAGALFPIEWRK